LAKFIEYFIIHKILHGGKPMFSVRWRMSSEVHKDPLLNAFSAVLRKARTDAGLSQEELAHRAGKSIRYISLLESRKHQPSLATLKSICDGLGLPMSEFVASVEAQLPV
ncbi:MAG: helix-turn-helix transcriptional regulator, partial [Paracoccaceae bacterium]